MNSSNQIKRSRPRAGVVLNRIADRVDLAIDVLTLGQYGLERTPEACEGNGGCEPRSRVDRRRGDCAPAAPISWDWPRARGESVTR